MHIDWDNTVVTGISGIKINMPRISGIKINMPTDAKASIFMDKNLTHINDDHFEINLVAWLLNQIYVVPVPPPTYDYNNSQDIAIDTPIAITSPGVTASAPPFAFTT